MKLFIAGFARNDARRVRESVHGDEDSVRSLAS